MPFLGFNNKCTLQRANGTMYERTRVCTLPVVPYHGRWYVHVYYHGTRTMVWCATWYDFPVAPDECLCF
jgi:hypothetical protein